MKSWEILKIKVEDICIEELLGEEIKLCEEEDDIKKTDMAGSDTMLFNYYYSKNIQNSFNIIYFS